MAILRPFLELFVVAWTAWVVVFQFAIATQIPTRALPLLFFVALTVAILPWSRGWSRSLRRAKQADWRLILELVVVAMLLAAIVLVTSRPDADDLGYLRGPLIDAAAPDEPIRVDPFRWDDRPWPVLRLLHENEAYEPFVVMASRFGGLDPLMGYHNVFAAISVFVWCAVLASLLNHFRMPRRWIASAVLLAAFLLFLDGGTHRSFGNLTLIRLWQGKIVAWAVVLPLFVLFQLRFLARPQISRFLLVVMAAIVGVAFNRSMVVMLVVAGTALPIAYAIAFGLRRHRLRRVGWAVAAPAPGWILGAVVLILAWRASPGEVSGALAGWPTNTAGAAVAFDRIAGGAWTIAARDLLLLGALPLLVLGRPLQRLLAAFSLVAVLISYAPPIGGLLSMALGPSVWRLYLVLPIPLCLGLLVLIIRPDRRPPRWQRIGRWTVVGLIAVLWASEATPVLSSANGVEWKSPLAYRLPAAVREFVQQAGPLLESRPVLAAEPVAIALGLTHYDRVDLIATRTLYASGDRRTLLRRANRALSECLMNVVTIAALQELLTEGAELVVFADCDDSTFPILKRDLSSIRLQESITAGGYRLFEVHQTVK